MGKFDDVARALEDLETALDIISNNVVMPVSGNIYPFYKRARMSLAVAKKSIDSLHEHPYKEERSEVENPEEPDQCYCNATNHPPCGFCEHAAKAEGHHPTNTN